MPTRFGVTFRLLKSSVLPVSAVVSPSIEAVTLLTLGTVTFFAVLITVTPTLPSTSASLSGSSIGSCSDDWMSSMLAYLVGSARSSIWLPCTLSYSATLLFSATARSCSAHTSLSFLMSIDFLFFESEFRDSVVSAVSSGSASAARFSSMSAFILPYSAVSSAVSSLFSDSAFSTSSRIRSLRTAMSLSVCSLSIMVSKQFFYLFAGVKDYRSPP